ncbi:MAG: hypothetical protein IJR39_05295 [Treponema sp.]|nr:hypothetical protein [Treponema sp.]
MCRIVENYAKERAAEAKKIALAEGLKHGVRKNAIANAKNFLKEGDSPEKIARCCSLSLAQVLALTTFAFAEKVTFTTGDIAGSSLTDRFMPMDFSMLASQCTVSAIKKVDKDIWCIKITASKQGGASSIPIEYEYFVKKSDKIRMRRISAQGMSECELTVESLDWNRAEFSF